MAWAGKVETTIGLGSRIRSSGFSHAGRFDPIGSLNHSRVTIVCAYFWQNEDGLAVRYGLVAYGVAAAMASGGAAAGDEAAGRETAIGVCARCHVIGDFNPNGGINSTPSFWIMARKPETYSAKIMTFDERRPHRGIGLELAQEEKE